MASTCCVIGCSNGSNRLKKWWSEDCRIHYVPRRSLVCGCEPQVQSVLFVLLLGAATLSTTESAFAGSGARNPRTSDTDKNGRSAFKRDKPSNLVLLQMLFRHGDRSPMHFFPWDKHQSFWPQGPAQLTQIGMQQAYHYGKELRQKYNNFLSKDYNRSEVEVQSTDKDRTLMTAQCLLAGLFPANFTWPLSPWQPIPVHTQLNSQNHLFAHAPCPELDLLNKQYESSEPSMKFTSKYQPVYNKMSNLTHTEVNRDNAGQIADMLFCESQHNLSRPQWMTDDMFHQLMSLRDEKYTLHFKAAGTPRLSGGPMLAEMIKNMEERAKDPASTKKVFLFSAHDSNIAMLGRALGIFNNLQPPYVTSITLELHQQEGNFFVTTLFNNHTTGAPFKENITGCATACPLQQFHDLLRGNMLSAADRPAACTVAESSHAVTKTVLPILAVALIVVVVVFLLYRLKRTRQTAHGRESNFQYRQLLQPLSDSEDDDDHIDEL
ncbi:lysosomal acid phosphatase-like isoform X2 [Littorina saxatilis]|uniref:lysosomal acid phosphatase-like isoform X2 n=1 Tax=Littorina saxatilis TaxID=31220 RepID=UPI0038B4431D